MRSLLLIVCAATSVAAQAPVVTGPQLVASGRGEVEVSPNRAELTLSVETRAKSGAAAGQENAAIVAAVLDSLRKGFRLTEKDLTTAGYMMRPEMSYPSDGRPPQVEGYVVQNMIRVRISEISRVGAIIDAALQKRASNVAGLMFSSSSIEVARRQALAIAVDNARRDAEVMAKAAGGTLGDLIELTSAGSDGYRPQPLPMLMEARMSRDGASTEIQAGDQKITAQVSARWRFVPPAR
jgi:uncharacterized protein YggE